MDATASDSVPSSDNSAGSEGSVSDSDSNADAVKTAAAPLYECFAVEGWAPSPVYSAISLHSGDFSYAAIEQRHRASARKARYFPARAKSTLDPILFVRSEVYTYPCLL